MSRLRKLEFRLGSTYLTLEVPPFYLDFEKRNFGSIMKRRQLPRKGIVIYVYVTRYRYVENLLLLNRLHPDLQLPEELMESAAAIKDLSSREFEEFMRVTKIEDSMKAIERLEEEWEYGANGVWLRKIDPFTLNMLLIMKHSRWTVRPAISKENTRGYGFELPVDAGRSQIFMKHLREGELEDIHYHVENQHFHLTLDTLERCIGVAKEWDYFSTRTKWRQSVFLSESWNSVSKKELHNPLWEKTKERRRRILC